jgi:hypothetical protein
MLICHWFTAYIIFLVMSRDSMSSEVLKLLIRYLTDNFVIKVELILCLCLSTWTGAGSANFSSSLDGSEFSALHHGIHMIGG